MVDRVTIFALLVAASVVTCSPQRQAITHEPFFSVLPLGAPPLLPVPVDNPITRGKVELGQRLFFEKGLSGDGTLACASCHSPDKAFTDGQRVPTGLAGRIGRRDVPTILNRAYGIFLFWDGRAASLEEQALQPMVSPTELGGTYNGIVRRLQDSKSYRQMFLRAFGSEEITIQRVAHAIASFERTLVSEESPFDRYDMLQDTSALSATALRGLILFRGKANCILCHSGPNVTDEQFHNTGVSWAVEPIDYGRYEVTQKEDDRGKFKTPTLRDLKYTGPYMHNGIFAALEEVIEFYDKGGIPNPRDWAINQ